LSKPILAAFAARLSSTDLNNSELPSFTLNRIKIEVLSGLTVSLALIPEAVAFSFVAGVHPLVGLYAAFIVGLITAAIGGRRGMISGATGALAVVMVALVAKHGVEYLFATVVLMGIFQVLAGILRLGKFIRLVPHPVMLGFVNGLAIVIFIAQLSQFQVPGPDNAKVWMTGFPLVIMLGLVVLTMLIIWGMPKLTNAIPAPLAGIAVVTGIVIFFNIDVLRWRSRLHRGWPSTISHPNGSPHPRDTKNNFALFPDPCGDRLD
jgi:SulP family sulfate permease